jgi:hypothetical protein
MRLARRRASLLRQAGMGACAAVLVIILLSMIWTVSYDGPTLYVSLDSGSLYFSVTPNAQPDGWSLALSRARPHFLFNFFPRIVGTPPRTYWRGYAPLWTPLALLTLVTAALWWRERRPFPPGRCATCGYDLTGNVSGRCPECGIPIQP